MIHQILHLFTASRIIRDACTHSIAEDPLLDVQIQVPFQCISLSKQLQVLSTRLLVVTDANQADGVLESLGPLS